MATLRVMKKRKREAEVSKQRKKRKIIKVEDIIIPEDILIEILRRLPVQAVYQCKVVSKYWQSLISSPYFMNHHYRSYHDRNEDNNTRSLLLLTSLIGISSNNLVFRTDRVIEPNKSITCEVGGGNKLVQFSWDSSKNQPLKLCNILFVSGDLVLMTRHDRANFTLVMYNPLIKQSLSLPWPPDPYVLGGLHNFEGCLRSKDNPTHFKVVLVQPRKQSHDDGHSEWFLDLFVLCSQDGKWSKFSVLAPSKIAFREMQWSIRSQYATVCNGMLYWTHNMIIGYDPFNKPNECEFIDLPDNCGIDLQRGCIANVQGCIRLYDWAITSTTTMSFWDLTDYTNRVWSRKLVRLCGTQWCHIINSFPGPMTLSIKGFNPIIHGDVVYVLFTGRLLLAITLQNITTDEQINADLKLSSVQIVTEFKPRAEIASRFFPFVPPAWPTPLNCDVSFQNYINSSQAQATTVQVLPL